VVGMACKVAGADDIDEFWDLLVAGKSQHREINKADIQSARFDFQDSAFRSTDDANMRRKWFANLMDGHDEFDHRFFKKSARESASMDPQQRQLLQVAYQAVEQSGYLRSAQTERDLNVGTFVGVCLTDYENNVASHPANAFTTTGNLQGFIAGKVSHFFGWTGPGLTIDTACSSSLVAVHQACQSILSGECDAALAGGSHILTSATWFQNLAAGSFLSPTGQCKPFDAKGDGYCRGEGVGAVFLKRMSKALEDNDQIIGCIAASAVQQNQSCTPIFVPNAPSLSDLFSKVVTKARVRPSQISYIEAHGTGTPVGDPAEYDGIRQVLGGARRSPEKPLTLGSVKGLVGHLECTSGIISLIKVLLMLNKGTLAPQASFDTLNPSLNAVAADNILIPTRPLAWDSDFRIALINNYGASGSNASMIVTEPPVRPRIDPSKQETASRQPFWLSATDAKGLERNVRKLRQYISQLDPSMTIENISYNLARRSNRALESRWIFSASSIPELERSLSSFDKPGTSGASSNDSPVVLCFGGQVSNFIGLDQNLYDRVANLRYHIDAVDSVVCSLGYDSILPSIFQRSPIADTVRLQCALFATQYAFARTWLDAGIRPAALVGHSFGELTALCISQMLSLEDTVRLIASRAALVRDAWGDDHGTMIAAGADRGDIEAVLNTANGSHKDVPASIACYNGPTSFTIAGSTAAIEAVRTELQRTPMQRVRYKDLSVTNAFHSALVDPICEQLEEVARGLKFRQPVIHLEHATQERLSSPLTARFVADHMRKPVCFQQAVERIVEKLGSSSCTFLEAGTNSTVTNMVRRVFSNSNEHIGHTYQAVNVANVEDGFNRLTDLTCSLWKGGLNVQHWAHHARQWRFDPGLKSIPLPPYQFDRDSKHWLDIQIAPKRHAKDAYPNVETTTPQPPKDEILRFSGYNFHGGRKVATYRLNTEMTEYSSVLAGHLTVGTAPICPATVQLAFVLETIGLERSDYSEGHEAQIQNVQYHCPLCQSPSRSTFIEVELVNTTTQQWRFEVLGVEATKSATRHSYTTGTVTFPRKDDQALKRELVRYGRLFGAHRATQLLERSDVDEVLTAQTLYRIFSEIVDYGDRFRGLRRLVNRGNESAGRVTRQSGSRLPFDPYLSDSFCQMGGIWINFVGEREPQDIYIANGIDHWLRAPVDLSEQSNEFIAFACHQRTAQASTTDVFVFDATTKTLVEAILGISYVRIPKLSMQKMLTRLTDPARLSKNLPAGVHRPVHNVPVDTAEDTSDPQALRPSYSSRYDETRAPTDASPKLPKTSNSGSSGVLLKIKRIIAELVGLDLDEVKDDSELADLGIDSLTGLELIHELETSFHTKLAQAEAFAVTNMPGLLNCVTQALGEDVDTAGTESSDDTDNTTPGASTSSSDEDSGTNSTTPVTRSDAGRDISDKTTSSTAFSTIMGAFRETKDLTDDRVVEYGQQDYSRSALPRQHELTVALTIEAFEKLGAGLTQAQPGEHLKHIPHGKEHRHLVSHLYRMLEAQTQVIIVDGESIVRTAVDMPKSSSREIYDDLLARYPDQVDADRLTYYAGVNLSRVLSGEIDGVKLVFGNPEGRQLASAFYAEWPLNKVVIAQMEDFLTRLANRLRANGEINEGTPLRIMEVGAGTGGTSRRIVPLLASLKIPVEYTFTDLAPSFVAAARKQWGKQYPFMKFRAYDVEKVPDADLKGTQHVVLASNAVHATHSLRDSTSNIRQILRDDGILLMMEMTRTPYWVDLIFGLFEGWWLFDDGRKHALSHESRWEADMYAAGYGIVDWTDGQRPETEIQKLIIAAASSTSSP
jgi:acyl carrier protein